MKYTVVTEIVGYAAFEVLTLAIIVVNALWMGYQLDADKSLTLATSRPVFQFVENIFTIYFTIEVTESARACSYYSS